MAINKKLIGSSGISAGTIFMLAALLCFAHSASAQVPSPVSLVQVVDANHVPSPQMVADAAGAINGASPSAIPTQTITVGGLDGATGNFYFNLPGFFPPDLPDYKKCQPGIPIPGCVPPRYMAQINSFSVRYLFGIANAPPDLSISIRLPDASGQMVTQPVPIDAARLSASVSIHPYWLQDHSVTFTGTFQSVRRTVTAVFSPYLKPQLGAFVVKHLLLAIVYEPPGSQSSSSFDLSNTTGTTWSFDFAGGSGIVQKVDTGSLLDTISNVASGAGGALEVLGNPAGWAAAGSIAPYVAAAGKVASVMKTLQGSQATTTTTVYTQSQSNSSGWSITVEKKYGTGGVHKYPGHGDKFVFLNDVLFVYTVANNRVQLAPVAFTEDRNMTIDELQAQDPGLAQKYGLLDLVLNPQAGSATQRSGGGTAATQPSPPPPIPPLTGGTIPSGGDSSSSSSPGGSFNWRPIFNLNFSPRMSYFSTPICEVSCPNGACDTLQLGQTQYSSTGTSQTKTQTTFIVDTPSLMQSILGEHTSDQYYTSSYTDTTQNWQQSAAATSVTLGCPEFAPTAHYVDVYIDYAFGTFLSILGPPVPQTNAMMGTVVDQSGQPAPRRQVTLKVGGKNYVVFSDQQGKFAVPLSVPTGEGVVILGKISSRVDFSKGPIRNITLKEGGGTQASIAGAILGNAMSPAALTPCCPITSIDAATGIVAAKVNDTGQSFQFTVKDSALFHSLKVGQGVFANFKTRQVSVNGKDDCCQIVSLATVKPGAGPPPTGGRPPNQIPAGQARPNGACCQITAINQQTGIVTAKVNATNQLFEFKSTDAGLVRILKVGQAIYANFGKKQVSLDGKVICCTIVAVSQTSSRSGAPPASR